MERKLLDIQSHANAAELEQGPVRKVLGLEKSQAEERRVQAEKRSNDLGVLLGCLLGEVKGQVKLSVSLYEWLKRDASRALEHADFNNKCPDPTATNYGQPNARSTGQMTNGLTHGSGARRSESYFDPPSFTEQGGNNVAGDSQEWPFDFQ
jgi:hypothetical protein